MRLVQLRYMKSVAGTGCFSTSARIFGVSQPTISNSISDLEEELHGKVFRRSTRCVELTPFGLSIIGYVDSIFQQIEEIEQQAERHARPDQRLVRVAFSPIVDGPRLFSLFESFRAGCRGLDFVYRECGANELETCLGQDRLDVICGIRIHDLPAQGRCPVYRELLRFLPRGGLGHAPPADSVNLAEISKEVLILPVDACGLASAVHELFRQQGLCFDEYPGHPLSYAVLQEWTREGLGAAILPESRIVGDARVYPVVAGADGRPESITVEAVWLRANHDPLVRQLTRFLRDNAVAATSGVGLSQCALDMRAPVSEVPDRVLSPDHDNE